MDIYGSQYAHNAHSLKAPHLRNVDLKSNYDSVRTNSAQPRDDVRFSQEAQMMSETNSASTASSSAAPRLDLINRVRSEISAGTYETPEKMNYALERMFGSF